MRRGRVGESLRPIGIARQMMVTDAMGAMSGGQRDHALVQLTRDEREPRRQFLFLLGGRDGPAPQIVGREWRLALPGAVGLPPDARRRHVFGIGSDGKLPLAPHPRPILVELPPAFAVDGVHGSPDRREACSLTTEATSPESCMTSIAPLFRTTPRAGDAAAVEEIVRATGVFSVAEIAIARELVEENLAKGHDASGYHFLFADGPDGLDGYTCFGPIPGTDRRYELYWIAVRKTAQRSKLAARLLRASEDDACKLGGVMMIAETSTRADYIPAYKFYQAQGYALLAEIPDWHADGDGLAIFGKRLR